MKKEIRMLKDALETANSALAAIEVLEFNDEDTAEINELIEAFLESSRMKSLMRQVGKEYKPKVVIKPEQNSDVIAAAIGARVFKKKRKPHDPIVVPQWPPIRYGTMPSVKDDEGFIISLL